MIGTIGLALLAGLLSTLSPCVLPLIPIVLGAAASEHRFGPVALAAGLAISFTAIGIFVATIGFAVGLDGGIFRITGAVLLILLGIVLLVPRLQQQFAVAASPAGSWAEERFGGFSTSGLGGQFAVGLLLGAAWSPCVGPTLGAASVLAAKSENLLGVALTMLAFGVGAALPLALLGLASREAMIAWKGSLASFGKVAKGAMGALLIALGIVVISGLDKSAEAWAVEHSPEWLTQLTTKY